jgi:cytochrome c-type biogenesis protein CcmH/NrfF
VSARRWLALLVATVALAAPAAVGAQGPEPQTSLPDIEDEVMCPICGVPLELAIDAPQAQQERAFIRELIAQGLTKEEIKDRLVEEFGSEVLAIPEAKGFDLAAWLVPGLAILAAGIGIFVGLRRWRKAGRGGPGGDGGPGGALSDEESQRLDADLARYRL